MSEQTFDCYFCGGSVSVQYVNTMRHWKGRYVLIENVPAYVCVQCGERYYDAAVAEEMDRIMRASETTPIAQREIRVPVVEMPTLYPTTEMAGIIVRDKTSENSQ